MSKRQLDLFDHGPGAEIPSAENSNDSENLPENPMPALRSSKQIILPPSALQRAEDLRKLSYRLKFINQNTNST